MKKQKPIQYPPPPPNSAPYVFFGILLGLIFSALFFVSYAAATPAPVCEGHETK
jgi:hypothetical protein